MGLQTLRLSSALILPFNTTNYAFELEYYVSKSVNFLVLESLLTTFDRVEELAVSSSTALILAPLRAAIKSLQFASLEFDIEKLEAERVLKLLIRKWHKSQNHQYVLKGGCFQRFMRRLRGSFTAETYEPPAQMEGWPEKDGANAEMHQNDDIIKVEGGHWPHLPKHPHWPHWPHKPRHPPRKLIKAVKAVRKINQKLASFERGFIHEDGIKDREWYRHLGVAPGKWLGMGLHDADVGCRG